MNLPLLSVRDLAKHYLLPREHLLVRIDVVGDEAVAEGAVSVVVPYSAPGLVPADLTFSANLVTNTWLGFPFMMVIALGALQSIPHELYEASSIDGARPLRQFFSITLPLLSPSTYFLSLLGIIGTFKAFTHLYVLRSSAAAGAADRAHQARLGEVLHDLVQVIAGNDQFARQQVSADVRIGRRRQPHEHPQDEIGRGQQSHRMTLYWY